MPVLMVDPLVLGYIEPDKSEGAVLTHPRKQIGDLLSLVSIRTHRGLRHQDRKTGQHPYLNYGLAEDAGKSLVRTVVVAIDTDPGDVLRAGPPRGNRPSAGLICLECPQPGDVVGVLAAEQRHDVPP